MKNLFFSYLAILFLCSFQPQPAPDFTPDDFIINKGVNLANFLSYTDLRGAARDTLFQERDIIAIKDLGFDFIRLPIAEDHLWDEVGKRLEDGVNLLKRVIDWCQKHELRVVVDMHVMRSHDFGNIENPLMIDVSEQEKFYSIWKDLSSILTPYSLAQVAYELLNAPYALEPEQWNKILANTIKIIREQEPQRILIIGSNLYQSPSTFYELKVPDDKNIMLSFQFWEPFLLTFYKADWAEFKDYTVPVHYPGPLITPAEFDSLPASQQAIVKDFVGVVWNRERIEQAIQQPFKKARELGVRLLCSEYGAMAETPDEDKIRYFNDLLSVFTKYGIA